MMDEKARKFRRAVWAHYRNEGRHELPWRKTRDPYKILVSEVMLQQTQVDRALPFYKNFLKKFPTVRVLAKAPLSGVLRAWQGLGYNRRAKMLWQAARVVVKDHKGKFPRSAREFEELPGVGAYTARAVAAFAYSAPEILIETNIRTAVMHHFFARRNPTIYGGISDKEIEKVLKKVMPKKRVREWYWALMDYGSYLKRSGVRVNARSRHYVKQKPFTGSNREARGAILRELAKGPRTHARLLGLLDDHRRAQAAEALDSLIGEELVEKHGRTYRLPESE